MNGRQARTAGRKVAEREAAEWQSIAADAVEALRLMQMQRPLNLLGERAIARFEAKVDAATLARLRERIPLSPDLALLERAVDQ